MKNLYLDYFYGINLVADLHWRHFRLQQIVDSNSAISHYLQFLLDI